MSSMLVLNDHSITLFDTPMHVLSMADTLDVIKYRLDEGEFTQHVVVNVAKIVHMQSDTKLRSSVSSCDIINIDGMGVVWGAKFLGHKVPERVAGVDLFMNLVALSEENSYPIYLLGATQLVVDATAEKLRLKHPGVQIAGSHHGYFWDDEEAVVKKIKASRAKLLFVAITSPKKENFINQWKDELGVDFVMGVGGTFDVVAGKVKRAPVWMQKSGLEWLYRVIQEPGRMWKRYANTNSVFLWMLIKKKFHQLFSEK